MRRHHACPHNSTTIPTQVAVAHQLALNLLLGMVVDCGHVIECISLCACMTFLVNMCTSSASTCAFFEPSLHHLDFFLEIFYGITIQLSLFYQHAEPAQFDQGDYFTTEGPKAHIRVVVQQIVECLHDVHLLLTPLTYAQYLAHRNQSGSTLPPMGPATSDLVAATLATAGGNFAVDIDDRQDFNNSVQHLFFPASLSYVAEDQHVDFPVFDDDVDEYSKFFIIVLDVDRNLTDVDVIFTPKIALGFIDDDDC